MAALPPDGEPNSEPLKYKTWVLKVSIHCEGCKRKVKRILHSVDGVYTIEFETKQHKVIVTGNVDANTLIRKLEKSGKHAELWPDLHRKPNKSNHSSQDDQQPPPPPPNEDDPNQPQIQNDNPEQVSGNDQPPPPQQQNADNPPQHPPQNQHVVKEVRFEGNPPPSNDVSGAPAAAPGGGGAKKKKKKKSGGGGGSGGGNPTSNGNGNDNNSPVNNSGVKEQQAGGDGGPPCSESPPPPHQPGMGPGPYPDPNPGPGNMGPRGHMGHQNRGCEYQPAHHAGPPPVYAVSYNTAYPRSYGASYYSAPPPYSYAYVHDGGYVDMPLPLDLTPVQPADTFELFSDENPNACSVM